MSAQELITDHLDLWTGAVTHKSGSGRSASGKNGKIELTGIKKLRDLILELAVRGKLVEQDPSDEPASVLLDRITEEKARLVKEGKIRKQKRLPDISEEEKPFELPSGWTWFRVGNHLEFQYGKALSAKNRNESGSVDVYGSNGVVGKHDQPLTEEPCIVIGRKGSAGALNKAPNPSWITDVAYFLIPPVGFQFDYCHFLLTSLKLDQLGKGIKPGINRNEAYSLVAALPPLNEQHRIVEKVDELMALCDRLEQQVGNQLEAHEVLVDTLLGALTRSSDAAELAEHWNRVSEHFDTLFTTVASIDKLKQTILQLAVMGRLVPQESDDEPASRLLDKLAEEKARLVKEGKIKKPKRLPPIENNERSYQVHENWAWVRFQNIANEISTGPFGSMIHKHDYINNGVPLINPSHMINGSIQEDVTVSISPQKAEELSSYKLNESDIVMARRGEVGRCAIVSDREAGWLCGTGSFVLRFHEALSRRFILMMFATDGVRRYLAGNSVGTTMTNLNHGILNRMPVALPPINEQHRIVQKVDELMALCDQLKKRLSESGKTRSQLAETVVEQAVS